MYGAIRARKLLTVCVGTLVRRVLSYFEWSGDVQPMATSVVLISSFAPLLVSCVQTRHQSSVALSECDSLR